MEMRRPVRGAVILGLGAAAGLLALYLGILTLLESWPQALDFLREDAVFVGPLVVGFGVQVGLYTLSRHWRPQTVQRRPAMSLRHSQAVRDHPYPRSDKRGETLEVDGGYDRCSDPDPRWDDLQG
jgi:hypothetical protein